MLIGMLIYVYQISISIMYNCISFEGFYTSIQLLFRVLDSLGVLDVQNLFFPACPGITGKNLFIPLFPGKYRINWEKLTEVLAKRALYGGWLVFAWFHEHTDDLISFHKLNALYRGKVICVEQLCPKVWDIFSFKIARCEQLASPSHRRTLKVRLANHTFPFDI